MADHRKTIGPRDARGPDQPRTAPTGMVTLVGAGPGDPGLMTLKALRRLREADLVLHDALLPPAVLALVPPDAELVLVGEKAGRGPHRQDGINTRMIMEARAGRRVVRLKGGDPFLFGRGGEEIEALDLAGVPWEAIPGITAAFGAASEFGIPLTHRSVAHALRLATATTAEGALTSGKDVSSTPQQSHIHELAGSDQETLVLYMPGHRMTTIGRELVSAGRSPSTPVAVIERATWADQSCHRTTLADLAGYARDPSVRTPVLLLVGATAARARSTSPVAKPRLALATVLQELSRWSGPLGAAGFDMLQIPVQRIVPAAPVDLERLRQRIRTIHDYTVIRFHDPHTIEPFLSALFDGGQDLRALAALRIEAGDVGTAERLRERGLIADCTTQRPESRRPWERCLDLTGPAGEGVSRSGRDGAQAGVPGSPSWDRIPAYALGPMSIDQAGLEQEIRRSPPIAWLIGSPEAGARMVVHFEQVLKASRILALNEETWNSLRHLTARVERFEGDDPTAWLAMWLTASTTHHSRRERR